MKKDLTIISAAALVLAGCVGVASAQEEAPVAEAAQADAPPQGGGGFPPPVTMADRPNATGGEALFVVHCISCHGPIGMGTGLLARTRPVDQLELREGLTPAFVILAARNGIGNMPAIPRGEVTDEELQAIGEYLAAGPHGGGQ